MGVDPVDEVGGLCVHSWVAGLGAPEHAFYHTVFLLYFLCICVCLYLYPISHTEHVKILTYYNTNNINKKRNKMLFMLERVFPGARKF